jgi:hypothetical protein
MSLLNFMYFCSGDLSLLSTHAQRILRVVIIPRLYCRVQETINLQYSDIQFYVFTSSRCIVIICRIYTNVVRHNFASCIRFSIGLVLPSVGDEVLVSSMLQRLDVHIKFYVFPSSRSEAVKCGLKTKPDLVRLG